MGLDGLEPSTPALSTQCSNQLCYRPNAVSNAQPTCKTLQARYALPNIKQPMSVDTLPFGYSRKEVIQPHLPIRLPCYDFTPVMKPSVVSALPKVRLPTSARFHSHGVTGGVYKTLERIHRAIADTRLLAIPTSRSRVADFDPN